MLQFLREYLYIAGILVTFAAIVFDVILIAGFLGTSAPWWYIALLVVVLPGLAVLLHRLVE